MELTTDRIRQNAERNSILRRRVEAAETATANPVLSLQQTTGNQAVQELLRTRAIRDRFAISQPRVIAIKPRSQQVFANKNTTRAEQ